jgi:hypothetical protein
MHRGVRKSIGARKARTALLLWSELAQPPRVVPRISFIMTQTEDDHAEKGGLPPAYSAGSSLESSLGLTIVGHPRGKDFLITLAPPKEPLNLEDQSQPGPRAPVDIVLVIDISASMDAEAPAPGESGMNAGFFVHVISEY